MVVARPTGAGMRRRAVVLGAPLGLLALAACGPEEDAPPPALDPAPVLVGERAEMVPYTELNLPLEMTPMIVVDPGWTSAPFALDGILLAHREQEDHLRYLAVDQDGTVLWNADRPLTCTDMVLTRGEGGEPVAVLSDLVDGASTLSGYHLRTAELLWGPVPVPGPQAALGLVRGEGGGSRAVLDGGTGEVRLEETELAGGRILGEHLGIVLCVEGEELRALDPAGEELWRAPLPAGVPAAEAEVLGAVDPATGFAAIGGREGGGAVLALQDGRVIAEEARAVARDRTLEVTVVASGRTVRGLDDDGTELWRHQDPEPLVLLCAGERLAYAVRPQEGTVVVLDTREGRMIQPYDVDAATPIAVPEVFSDETAAAVRVHERRLLVTTEFDPEYGRR